jgi:hypothetical protein
MIIFVGYWWIKKKEIELFYLKKSLKDVQIPKFRIFWGYDFNFFFIDMLMWFFLRIDGVESFLSYI